VLQIALATQDKSSVLSLLQLTSVTGTQGTPLQPRSNFTHEEFTSETALLTRFVELVREYDPDYVTGWNVLNFDLHYIGERAKLLGVKLDLGRNGGPCRRWEKETHTRAHGTRVTQMFDMFGRIVFDSMAIYQKILNEPSYKLQNVAMKYLNTGKCDMPYSEIFGHMQTPEGRLRVAEYCWKDADLVLRLLTKLKTLERFAGLAAVTGAPLKKIIHNGQQIRCFSALLKENFECKLGFAFPDIELPESRGYEGATVITPDIGAQSDVIATLDFAALYPSLMRAYNICWSTKFRLREVAPVPLGDTCPYKLTEIHDGVRVRRGYSIKDGILYGDTLGFTQQEEGIVPRVEAKLYAKRKEVKAKMKESYCPILDAYQLALKLVMNSMYGLLGAKQGYLPDVELAEFITGMGRMFIEWTRIRVERIPHLHVCGGDTDSVFVMYVNSPDWTAIKYHEYWDTIAKDITATYGHEAMNLEYEKMYRGEPGCLSWLLVAKKRYAGHKWDAWATKGKLVYTGLECKRRDFCEHTRDAMKRLLGDLFTGGVQQALDTLHATLMAHIRQPSGQGFLLSKQFFKQAHEYANAAAQPHVQVALRTRASVGDRVDYLICWASNALTPLKDASLADRAFAPHEAHTRALPLDMRWYFESQFKKPLKRMTDLLDVPFAWDTLHEAVNAERRRHAKKRNREGFNKLFRV
jgi:DNA polymerase delta subunit 1